MLSQLKKDQIRGFLLNPQTFATTLLTVIIDNYGAGALNADLGLVLDDLCSDYNIDRLPDVNSDKIGAIFTALTTDLFYTDWMTFNQTCEAFNDDPVHPDVIDPATPEQMAWGVIEMALHEDPKDKPDFSENVAAYVGTLLGSYGLTRAPADLKFAKMSAMPDSVLNEDQDLFKAYHSRVDEDLTSVQNYVMHRAKALFEELNSIPLQQRDSEAWKNFFETAHKKLSQ